jgi:hypothetical protein
MSNLIVNKPGMLTIIIDNTGHPHFHVDGFEFTIEQTEYRAVYLDLTEKEILDTVISYAIERLQKLKVQS